MIIHFHFHSRATGITRTVESIVPFPNKYSGSFVFGYGIKAPKIGWISLLRLIYSDRKLVIHTHRNIEILFALFLRKMRGKFKLIFTRHSDGKPAKLSCQLMKKADHLVTLNSTMAENIPYPNTLIKHGENGFLFPKNDHEYLRKILTDIISGKINLDPDKIRQTVIDKWSLERSVKDLLKLYEISQVN